MNTERLDAAEYALELSHFEREEIEGRIQRLRSLMEASELDAILVSSKPNVTYLSGLVTESFASTARPIFVVVPREAEPTLVCASSQAPNARAASRLRGLATYSGFEAEAIGAVAGFLVDTGISGARLGLELGQEMRIGCTVRGLARLESALPGAEFADAAPLLWQLRMVKSEAEITMLEAAGRCNAAALNAVLEAVAPGTTERKLRAVWAAELARLGADFPGYFAIHSGQDSFRRVNGSASDRELEVGDLVWVDAGAVWNGYWSDITRMASVGEATGDRVADYEFSYRLVGELVDFAVPGVAVSHLAERARDRFAAARMPMNAISRVGHGIGLELTEPPSLAINDETMLQPGMTVAIEVGVSHSNGYFVVEDNVVITESGNRLLAPRAPSILHSGG